VLQDKNERFKVYAELVKRLPIEHRETLRHLLRHLTRVIDLSDQNRMSLKNVAVLFGPNIMRAESMGGHGGESSASYNPLMVQNVITEYILVNFKELFSFPPTALFNEYADHLIS
jgi:hypothetical protein